MRFITRKGLRAELATLKKPWLSSEAPVIIELRAFASSIASDPLTAEELSRLVLLIEQGLLEPSAKAFFEGLRSRITDAIYYHLSVFSFLLSLAKEGTLTKEMKTLIENHARLNEYNLARVIESFRENGLAFSAKAASLVLKFLSDIKEEYYYESAYQFNCSLHLIKWLAEEELDEETMNRLQALIKSESGGAFLHFSSLLFEIYPPLFTANFPVFLSKDFGQAVGLIHAIFILAKYANKEGKTDPYLVSKYKDDLIEADNPLELAQFVYHLNRYAPQFLTANYEKCKGLSISFPKVYLIVTKLAKAKALHQANLNDLIKYAAIFNQCADEILKPRCERGEDLPIFYTWEDINYLRYVADGRLIKLCDEYLASEGEAKTVERIKAFHHYRQSDYMVKTWSEEELRIPELPSIKLVRAPAASAAAVSEPPVASGGAGAPPPGEEARVSRTTYGRREDQPASSGRISFWALSSAPPASAAELKDDLEAAEGIDLRASSYVDDKGL